MNDEKKPISAEVFGISDFDVELSTSKSSEVSVVIPPKPPPMRKPAIDIDSETDVYNEAGATKDIGEAWAKLTSDIDAEIPARFTRHYHAFKVRRDKGVNLTPEERSFMELYEETLDVRKQKRADRIAANNAKALVPVVDPGALGSRSMRSVRGATEENSLEEKSNLAVIAETYEGLSKSNEKRALRLDELSFQAFSQQNVTNKILQEAIASRDKSMLKLVEAINDLSESNRELTKKLEKARSKQHEAEDKLRDTERGMAEMLQGGPDDLMKRGVEVYEMLKGAVEMLKHGKGS